MIFIAIRQAATPIFHLSTSAALCQSRLIIHVHSWEFHMKNSAVAHLGWKTCLFGRTTAGLVRILFMLHGQSLIFIKVEVHNNIGCLMSKILSSRLAIFKFLGTFAILHAGVTYFPNKSNNKVMTMTISDYLRNNQIDEKTELTIVGTIKPRSVRNKTTTLGKDFVLTDHRNDLSCSYEGFTKGEFREGETTLVKGYCPNMENRQKLVVKDYYTKHSMDTKEWESKTNVARNNYGVQSYR